MPQRAKVSGCGRTHTQSLLLIFFSTCSLSIYFPLRAHTYIHIYIRRILSRGCALNGFSVCETMHASIHRRAFSHQPTQALAIPLHTLLNSFALQSLYKLDFWCAVCGPFSSTSRLGACVCVRFFFFFVPATFLGIFLSVRGARNILNAITTITKAKTSTSSRGNNNNSNALAVNNEKLLRISPHRSGAAKQAYPCWSFAVLVLCRRCHEMSASRKSSVTAAPAVH